MFSVACTNLPRWAPPRWLDTGRPQTPSPGSCWPRSWSRTRTLLLARRSPTLAFWKTSSSSSSCSVESLFGLVDQPHSSVPLWCPVSSYLESFLLLHAPRRVLLEGRVAVGWHDMNEINRRHGGMIQPRQSPKNSFRWQHPLWPKKKREKKPGDVS